jgi:hypothetical protein
MSPLDETRGLDPPAEADRAKAAAVDALKARMTVEEKAERSKLRADDALQMQRSATEAAERARVEAEEAEQARRTAEADAERARVAAEEALQTWREKLAKALEAEVAAPQEVPPPTAADLDADLEGRVTSLSAVSSPEVLASRETCVISYRLRELDSAIFYARAFDEEGGEVVLAESDRFETSSDGAPDRTEEAVAALDRLSAQLAGDGWEPVAHGDEWFERVFRRRVSAARR